MKKIWLYPLIILSASLLLDACKKNSVEEQYTETVHPVVPDLSTQINASVDGFITDENSNAAEGAIVSAGTMSATTDAYGYFKITNASFAKSAGFIKVTKAGYFTGFRTFLPQTGEQAFIRLQLLPKTITGTIDATAGGTINIGGASVTLPANGVVLASNSTAYTGIINVSIQWLNPENIATTQLTMPGDLRGIDTSGYLNVLTTYGMLAVELTNDAGAMLQIANGQHASLSLPIPASIQANAPASIPLWYFDESCGLWREDGAAVKNAGNYQGNVSHFTYWNCDVPSGTVNFDAQVVNTQLTPLANVPVSVTIAGSPGSTHTDYTDINGRVHGMIPAGSNLSVTVTTPASCNGSVYTQSFTTTNRDVDLGTITVNPLQYDVSFKGYVRKCNGSPVTDGYVIIASGLTNKVVEINNGDFSVSSLACPGGVASVVAIDRETAVQSIIYTPTIATGLNNLDTLDACATTQVESISYLLDGVPKVLTGSQYYFTVNYDFANTLTTIHVVDLLNGSLTVFDITLSGIDATGVHTLTASLILDQQNYTHPATPVNLTEYGLIGQFISGSIPSITINGPGGDHSFSCSFSVRRDG